MANKHEDTGTAGTPGRVFAFSMLLAVPNLLWMAALRFAPQGSVWQPGSVVSGVVYALLLGAVVAVTLARLGKHSQRDARPNHEPAATEPVAAEPTTAEPEAVEPALAEPAADETTA